MKKKLAKLTKQEAATYAGAFEHYFNNVRRSNQRADRFAWRKAVESSPRLAAFEGAKP